MVDSTFAERVRRLEKDADRNPKRYRFHVLLFAALGYGYIGFFLALFLALVGFSVFLIWDGGATLGNLKFLALTTALSILILKAMWIRTDMPEGKEITAQDAPKLFQDLQDLSRQMKAPQVEKVILDDRYNAGVTHVSRLGILGWNRYILVLGLPLLMTHNREQMKAVLAHELAHLSKKDTRMGAWVYRVRFTWQRLLVSMEENEQFGTFLFRWFFRWYFPRFDAYAFVLCRQEETIADRLAAEATRADVMGESLVQLHVHGRYFNEGFNRAIIHPPADSEKIPTPAAWLWEHRNRLSHEKAQEYLLDALRETTDLTDTHPCLKDRLYALGVPARLPVAVKRTAAEEWLTDLSTWMRHFDNDWLHHAEDSVRQLRKAKTEAEARIVELEQRPNRTREESLELAGLYTEWKDIEDAIPVYQHILEQYGDDKQAASAHLELGKCYLQLGEDQKGIRHIKQAVALDWSTRQEGYELLEAYYWYTGEQEEALSYQQKGEEWQALLEEAEEEAQTLTEEDEWIAHGADPKWVEQLFVPCREQPSIQAGYLVRKVLETIPERDHYIIGLDLNYPADSSEEEYDDAIMEWATEEWLPEDLSYTILILDDEETREMIQSVPGSMVYQRKKKQSA